MSTKEKKRLSISTPRTENKKVGFENDKKDEKIANLRPDAPKTGLCDEILCVETVIGETTELSKTFTMAHNQMTLKYGQWVFYYVITKKETEEQIELMMYNLDKPAEDAICVDEKVLTKKKMSVYAPVIPVVKGAKVPDVPAPEFFNLEVFGTVGIHFNVQS